MVTGGRALDLNLHLESGARNALLFLDGTSARHWLAPGCLSCVPPAGVQCSRLPLLLLLLLSSSLPRCHPAVSAGSLGNLVSDVDAGYGDRVFQSEGPASAGALPVHAQEGIRAVGRRLHRGCSLWPGEPPLAAAFHACCRPALCRPDVHVLQHQGHPDRPRPRAWPRTWTVACPCAAHSAHGRGIPAPSSGYQVGHPRRFVCMSGAATATESQHAS